MTGEWITLQESWHIGLTEILAHAPQERTEIIYLLNGVGATVTLRIERVAQHWRVVDHTFSGPATGPALEGLERFPTCYAAREAADEWLAAWRARMLLGCP